MSFAMVILTVFFGEHLMRGFIFMELCGILP